MSQILLRDGAAVRDRLYLWPEGRDRGQLECGRRKHRDSRPGEGLRAGGGWHAGIVNRVFEGRYFSAGATTLGRTYDVSPDGQRFLMIKAAGGDRSVQHQIIVVQHWDEELNRLVPVR